MYVCRSLYFPWRCSRPRFDFFPLFPSVAIQFPVLTFSASHTFLVSHTPSSSSLLSPLLGSQMFSDLCFIQNHQSNRACRYIKIEIAKSARRLVIVVIKIPPVLSVRMLWKSLKAVRFIACDLAFVDTLTPNFAELQQPFVSFVAFWRWKNRENCK